MADLGKIPEFKKSFWKAIGDEVADRIRVHTTKGGKDVFNKNFTPYQRHAPFWFTKKVNGKTIRVYAEDYPTRKPKIARGGGNFGSKVNLQLSGDMMRNLQTRGFTNDSVVIGWSGAEAQKIGWNSEMGRSVTTKKKPISDGALRFVLKEIDRQIEKNIKKQTSKPINYKIGKR